MIGGDQIKTNGAGWIIVMALFLLLARWIRQFAAWVLIKLYGLFIGNKDPIAPV